MKQPNNFYPVRKRRRCSQVLHSGYLLVIDAINSAHCLSLDRRTVQIILECCCKGGSEFVSNSA